jgi:hypothetical protein
MNKTKAPTIELSQAAFDELQRKVAAAGLWPSVDTARTVKELKIGPLFIRRAAQ